MYVCMYVCMYIRNVNYLKPIRGCPHASGGLHLAHMHVYMAKHMNLTLLAVASMLPEIHTELYAASTTAIMMEIAPMTCHHVHCDFRMFFLLYASVCVCVRVRVRVCARA
jgi:hypothetical protein